MKPHFLFVKSSAQDTGLFFWTLECAAVIPSGQDLTAQQVHWSYLFLFLPTLPNPHWSLSYGGTSQSLICMPSWVIRDFQVFPRLVFDWVFINNILLDS